MFHTGTMKPEKIVKTSLFVFILTLWWITLVHAQSHQTRSGFDQPCNKTLKCKSQAWLICDDETEKCKCARSDDMIYDQMREKCVAPIGERCKYGYDEESGTGGWNERADCVKGSVCGPSGICSCPDGFYEDSKNGQCSRVKDNGQPCLNKNECDQEKFLNCILGKCRCDPDTSVYTVSSHTYYSVPKKNSYSSELVPSGICVGRVGIKCTKYGVSPMKYCVKNAYCKSDTSICRCMDTYGETSDKLCGLGYQQSCSDDTICSDKLRCSGYDIVSQHYSNKLAQQMKCLCRDPSFQTYDAIKTSCVGLVGAPCNPNDKSSCTDKSSCIDRDSAFQCECDEGFIDTDKGNCQIAFGSSCNYVDNAQVDISGVTLCDKIADLRCKQGKCSCKNDGQSYESNKRKCLTTVGLRCNATSECVSNSECIKSDGSYWGRCACVDGFSVTKQHICAVPSGADGSSEDDVFEDNDGQNFTLINI